MSTDRYFTCPKCGNEEWAGRLFDALDTCSRGEITHCGCGSERYLKLSFPFEWDSERSVRKVLRAFLPDPDYIRKWPNDHDGGEVAFYPFLVVSASLDKEDKKQTVWLPYWHVVTYPDHKTELLYGQWAPNMDFDVFINLVGKATRAGYL